MIVKRGTVLAISTAAFVLLCGFGLVCCTRSTAPGVEVAQPRADSGEEEDIGSAEVARQEDAATEPAIVDASRDESAGTIDMETPEKPEPKTPRYVSIVEQLHSGQDARVTATIELPTKLELTTDNVSRLRITREGLPLARDRSIVLRIDGQGIEWTRQYLAVELERSSAGVWTVVRRRPAMP